MTITTDITDNILEMTKSIENMEVVYKKKKKYSGTLAFVKRSPFEVSLLTDNKEVPEHLIDFESAEQITIKFFDGTVKTFMDQINL